MPVVINGSTGISGVDGSAGTPAYQGSDTNTGVFFPAADTIAFAEGGAEVMRIDSSGNVGIGTSSPSVKLDVSGDIRSGGGVVTLDNASQYKVLEFDHSGTRKALIVYDNTNNRLDVNAEAASSELLIRTAGVERARFNATGSFLVGTTAENYSSTANAVQILPATAIVCSKSATSNVNQIVFNNGNGQVGYINTSGSNTIFSTVSDYRLKNSVEPLSGGLSTVSALKPVTYKWNAGNAHGEGFIAHELAEHVPLAVSGEKDAVDENGNPIYQGVDYSKIVVHLVAAIQELKAQNDALTARIVALEGASA